MPDHSSLPFDLHSRGHHGSRVPEASAAPAVAPASAPRRGLDVAHERLSECQQINHTLTLLGEKLSPWRRMVHAGETVYQAGEAFDNLFVANSGLFKVVNLSRDGREQMAGMVFRGDWLGLDGIANGVHACDAIAMDTGEVWVFRYQSLLAVCASNPALMTMFHEAMSRQIARGRNSLMSVCTLPADARVANFLHEWGQSLQARGQRTDQIPLRMTRAEIGNHLGVSLETVSRALAHLARLHLITFPEKGRRDIGIPELNALERFVLESLAQAPAVLN